MTTVLIVDDHEISRAGIRVVLRSIPKLKIIGEAANGLDAIQFVKKHNPEIVFMDIQMPGIDGFETTRKIFLYNSQIKIIIVSCLKTNPYPECLFAVGASAYVSKSCAVDEITKAVNSVLLGKCYMSPAIAQQLALNNTAYNDSNAFFNILSLREIQIALMIISGKKIEEIAEIFYVSTRTIRAHRYQILKKLKVKNDVSLILLAGRLGYLKECVKFQK
jgi:two-component system invasion response regulator UvrY